MTGQASWSGSGQDVPASQKVLYRQVTFGGEVALTCAAAMRCLVELANAFAEQLLSSRPAGPKAGGRDGRRRHGRRP